MGSIMTYFVYLNTEDSHQNLTIYFWEIMLIVANNLWKLFVCYLRTKSNTLRTFSCYVATTNAHPSTEFTDFTTNAKGGNLKKR